MSIYARGFFKCTDCGFMLNILGQATKQPETCPCCQSDLDYASNKDREKYIEDLKGELKYMNS